VSITGISNTQNYQNTFQQIRTDFQQLGADLQAGNLSQAQSDYATLSQDIAGSHAQSNNTINQDFSALGQALQSGNLSDAQNLFSTLLQDLQQSAQVHPHHHHHHHGGAQGANSAGAQASNPITQAFDTLRSALQSGDLNSAQQAYSTLLQDLQQFGLNASAVSSNSAAAQTPGSNFSLTI
jgi:soluble cytochrome b562